MANATGSDWRPIETAPTDGTEVRVKASVVDPERWHPAFRDLPEFETDAAYHPDAGWTVCEVREATHWKPKDG